MKIKNILISQLPPIDFDKSPYADLTKKYSINLDFFKFFTFQGVSGIDFRKNKINILNHTAIVFSSTTAIDYFFNLLKDLRIDIPESMKYYCITDMVAFYLQKYITYRKRKIFFAKNNTPSGFFELILKNKEQKFLVPCGSGLMGSEFTDFFKKNDIDYSQAVVFNIVPSDIVNNVDIEKHDMIVFFSPSGVDAFKHNYPDFQQNEMYFAAMGPKAAEAVKNEGWTLHVEAPTKEAPSITAALDIFLKDHATKRRL